MVSPYLTILTTTYNRAKLLQKCYESLRGQTVKNFEWIIVDDGSNDATKEIIDSIRDSEKEFKIKYIRKVNGGKHTALNMSHRYITGEYVLMLDDDDELLSDAVEIILCKWKMYSKLPKVGCISFQKAKKETADLPLVRYGTVKDVISNTIDFRVNMERKGDCAEVIKSNIFKEFPAPVFPGENFMSEDYLWINSSYKYDTVYVNHIIYICDYREDGLTKSGHKMKLKNPKGGMYTSNLYLNRHFKFKVRVRNSILFDCYAIAADGKLLRNIQSANNSFLCLLMIPIAYLFYIKWR